MLEAPRSVESGGFLTGQAMRLPVRPVQVGRADQSTLMIMPAPTVRLVDSSMMMKPPVVRLRR